MKPEISEALLRIAAAEQPMPAADLWRRASRETHTMTPFAIHALQQMVDDGRLHRDEHGTITVPDE